MRLAPVWGKTNLSFTEQDPMTIKQGMAKSIIDEELKVLRDKGRSVDERLGALLVITHWARHDVPRVTQGLMPFLDDPDEASEVKAAVGKYFDAIIGRILPEAHDRALNVLLEDVADRGVSVQERMESLNSLSGWVATNRQRLIWELTVIRNQRGQNLTLVQAIDFFAEEHFNGRRLKPEYLIAGEPEIH